MHDAILEILICGDTSMSCSQFKSELSQLMQDDGSGHTRLQTQYELLSHVTPDVNDVIQDAAMSHHNKNRSDQYLPRKTNYTVH